MLRFERRARVLLGLVAVSLASACGGGGSGGSDYITWQGSANGEFVLDVTDEAFRVQASDGRITYTDPNSGETTVYTNTFVDDDADVFLNGQHLGGVFYIKGENDSTITGFVCNNNFFLDIHGPTGSPTFNCNTGINPVFASVSTGALGAVAAKAVRGPGANPQELQPIEGTSVQPNLDSSSWSGGPASAN